MADEPKAARQKHVLVVDDNVELAQTYRELLQLQGWDVTLAHDGVQALKLIGHLDVDAILCDLSMPGLEGDMFYNAAQHVRPELTQRFIFVTGHAGNPKYDGFLKSSKARVLYKPVPVAELLLSLKLLIAETA
jgi:two-component system, NtrC family, C4-dicarboxylate transport response regulator DctD